MTSRRDRCAQKPRRSSSLFHLFCPTDPDLTQTEGQIRERGQRQNEVRAELRMQVLFRADYDAVGPQREQLVVEQRAPEHLVLETIQETVVVDALSMQHAGQKLEWYLVLVRQQLCPFDLSRRKRRALVWVHTRTGVLVGDSKPHGIPEDERPIEHVDVRVLRCRRHQLARHGVHLVEPSQRGIIPPRPQIHHPRRVLPLAGEPPRWGAHRIAGLAKWSVALHPEHGARRVRPLAYRAQHIRERVAPGVALLDADAVQAVEVLRAVGGGEDLWDVERQVPGEDGLDAVDGLGDEEAVAVVLVC